MEINSFFDKLRKKYDDDMIEYHDRTMECVNKNVKDVVQVLLAINGLIGTYLQSDIGKKSMLLVGFKDHAEKFEQKMLLLRRYNDEYITKIKGLMER